jgi:glycosyltransferase involved in cell wall biosynthesis
LLQAAELLKDKKDIIFIIVGKGKEKEKLILFKNKKKLNNVIFLDPIKKEQVITFLKEFSDAAYIGLRKKNLFKYGVSPNKIFDYMLAKKPIIHSINSPIDIVSQAKCGISVEAENPKAVADAILKIYRMPEKERKKMGESGYKFLLKNHTYEHLALKFAKEVIGK